MGLAKELNDFFKENKISFESFAFHISKAVDLIKTKFGPYKCIYGDRTGIDYDLLKNVFRFDNRPNELVAFDAYYYSSWEDTNYGNSQFYDVVETEQVIKVYTKVS